MWPVAAHSSRPPHARLCGPRWLPPPRSACLPSSAVPTSSPSPSWPPASLRRHQGPLVPPPYGEASARPMKLLPEPDDEDESDDRRLEQPPPSPPHVGEAATAATLGNGLGSGRGGPGIRPRWHGRVPPAPVGEAAAAAPGDGSSLVGMVACHPMAAPSDIPSGCGRQEMKRGSRPPCRHHPREPRRLPAAGSGGGAAVGRGRKGRRRRGHPPVSLTWERRGASGWNACF